MSSQVFALPVSFRVQNINNFCKDDFIRILRCLYSSEIARTVFLVCKKWLELGHDPLLWKEVHVDTLMYEMSYRLERQIIKVVKFSTLLEDLYLACDDDVTSILGYVGRFCPNLKRLHLELCSVDKVLSVQAVVLGCPKIEDLCLGMATGSALNEFAQLKELRDFDAAVDEDDVWFDDTFFTRLSSNNRHLECVTLDDNPYYNDKHLVPLLANLKSVLKSLCIDGSSCGRSTYETIAQCKMLEALSIGNALKLKNGDLDKLQTLPKLQMISFSNANKIGSNAFSKFITNLPSAQLQSVCFEACPKIDHTLEQVLLSCNDTIFHKVKRIDLSRCTNVTDRVLELILKGNPSLDYLKLASIPSLQGTAFNTTNTSIVPLLKHLNVAKCLQIANSYLYTFKKNRDHLKIVFPSDSEFLEPEEYGHEL